MKKHDLLDALTHADEALVERAASSMDTSPRSFSKVRCFRIGAIAASVAAVLAVGAIAIPMMLTDDPLAPPVSDTAPGTSNFLTQAPPNDFVQAPASILYLSSGDQPQSTDSIINSETQDTYWGDNVALLTFDCPAGETITVSTFWESLSTRTYPNDGHELWEGLDPTNAENRKTYLDILSSFHMGTTHISTLTKREITLDVNAEYLLWVYDTNQYQRPIRGDLNYYFKKAEACKKKFGEDSEQYKEALAQYQERYDAMYGDDYNSLQFDANEDLLSYVTRNADGKVTGVGAVYVCRKHLIEDTESSYYGDAYISRYADLGYVRFEAPVTEEEAQDQLQALYDTVPACKANMDFTPVGDYENYKAGLADLLNTVTFEAPENHYVTSGFGGTSAQNYRTYRIGYVSKDEEVIDGSHYDRMFLIYNDGTWKEITDEVTEEVSE